MMKRIGLIAACIWTLAGTLAAQAKDFGVPLTPPDPLEELAIVIRIGPEAPDLATFEKCVKSAKAAGFNTILSPYQADRLEACRKLGVKMMIDVAPIEGGGPDIRRPGDRNKLKEICQQLPGNEAVWGYFLCNGPLAQFAPGGSDTVNECLALLRTWDGSHPVWVGGGSYSELDKIQGTAGLLAANDVAAGKNANFDVESLTAGFNLCHMRVDPIGRTFRMDPDIRRTQYAINLSLAFGMKAMLWSFPEVIKRQSKPNSAILPHQQILRELGKLTKELIEMDRPVAVYGTRTTRTSDDQVKMPDVPPPLTPFPDNHWVKVVTGEAVVGFHKHDLGFDGLFVANPNALRPQSMTIQVKPAGDKEPGAELFDRRTGEWKRLKVEKGRFSFELQPGGGELVRVLGVASD